MKRILFLLTYLIPAFALAQLQDDFSDGDFTANPVWSGDAAQFIVNASQTLQLNGTGAATSYLSVPNNMASLDNMEWRFRVQQTFSPSSSNYGRIYIVSDQANVNGPVNGYYIQFGEALSNDAVELFLQDGTSSVSVCRGTNAEIANSFNVGIKITRDGAGLWTLSVDPTGGTNYIQEATGNDATYTSSAFLGVECVYTSSNATKFFFDDFYAGAGAVDVTPPTVTNATALSSTSLDVLFSEPVDAVASGAALNYIVDQGIGSPVSASRDGSNFSLVHLTFATAFTASINYTLTVTNVTDLAGNAITTNNNALFSYTADVVPPVLNSASATSSTQLDVHFSEDVDLTSAQSTGNYSVDNAIGNPTSAQRDASDFSLVHLAFANAFSDGINYTLTVNNVTDLAANAVAANSTAGFTYSTPSAAAAYDVVVNEIFPDPDPAVGLPPYEFIELYNRSSNSIDLSNWTITVGATIKTFTPFLLLPDSFVIICTPTAATPFSNYGTVLPLFSSSTTLTNDGTSITLKNDAGVVIDSVAYNSTYWHDVNKEGGGWTIERIDPDFTCASKDNWKASNDPAGGTPGKVNSVDGTYTDAIAPRLVRACLDDSLHLTVYFSEPVPDTSLNNIQNYTILQSGTVVNGGVTGATSAADGMSVSLTLLNSAANGNWSVQVNSTLSDCAGSPISDNTASFGTPVPASPGDIVINEVLFSESNGSTDFVELYNVSSKTIDLSTLKINNYSSLGDEPNDPVALSDGCYLMLPNTYLVLSDNADEIKAHYIILDQDAFLDMDLPELLTEEDRVVLKNDAGEVIDSLHYYSGWHFPLLNDVHNISLERLSFSRSTNDPSNWHSASEAAGFATPGYKNSQHSESGTGTDDVTILPEVFSPDNDGINDVVNIQFHFPTPGYLANVKIYDSKGRPVRTLVESQLLGNDGTFSWDGITDDKEKARTGIYVLFIEVFNLDGDVKEYKKTCVVATRL